ncbi:MAG: carboxypeptidase-like regulatory domain-containing protein, partial [bacterium]
MAVAEDAAGPQANVVGTVHDADKNAVGGADLVLLSTDGEEVGKTTTSANGTYSLGCIGVGTYHLELASGSDFEGQKVAAPVGPSGLTVAWAVDAGKPALASATATGGACGVTVAAAGAGAA